jgi:hypothetical protein
MAKSKDRAIRSAKIEELRAACQRLSNQRAALEEINEREDAEPWLGTCFRYLNRDSNGATWWLYIRVLAHESGNSFRVLQCQRQTGGWHIATAEDHTYLLPSPKQRGFVQITRREFDAAWRKFTAAVGDLNA